MFHPYILLSLHIISLQDIIKLWFIFTVRKQSLGQGNIFTPVCHSVHHGGVLGWWGYMHGCQRACVFGWGCAWLLGACVVAGGMHGCGGRVWLQGACMVGGGGHGCQEDVHGCRGVCMVGIGGHAWLLGCMHNCQGCMVACGGCVVARGGACVVAGGACIGYDEIRSMSERYASYWNAFLLNICSENYV